MVLVEGTEYIGPSSAPLVLLLASALPCNCTRTCTWTCSCSLLLLSTCPTPSARNQTSTQPSTHLPASALQSSSPYPKKTGKTGIGPAASFRLCTRLTELSSLCSFVRPSAPAALLLGRYFGPVHGSFRTARGACVCVCVCVCFCVVVLRLQPRGGPIVLLSHLPPVHIRGRDSAPSPTSPTLLDSLRVVCSQEHLQAPSRFSGP